jgi:hypothetical protein
MTVVLSLCTAAGTAFLSVRWSCCSLQLESTLCAVVSLRSRLQGWWPVLWIPLTLTGRTGMNLVQVFQVFCTLSKFRLKCLSSGSSVFYSLSKSKFSICFLQKCPPPPPPPSSAPQPTRLGTLACFNSWSVFEQRIFLHAMGLLWWDRTPQGWYNYNTTRKKLGNLRMA